ncbi:MAG: sigma-54 dependent transcriptional regulator [Porphyromonas sp.]|nr:sigma-54 dependent transcriptional regulator [Porphyromonas sp.]
MSQQELQQVKQRFGIIGNCDALNRAIEVALQIAKTDVSVLVVGESGVGKEVFPQIIHQNSARKHGTYIAVNCGAIPEGTIDSELFGHKKGSFTDAVSERNGYFEVANGGTIFLDEVGELPMPTQARLLRVLESGEFMKVGSSEVKRTDIRVVAATNVELDKAIKKKKFRQDLYYRLNTVTIELPPLRDRGEDIPLLFRKFASDFADKYRMPPIRLDEGAQRAIMLYSWPGNIRELRNLVERISVVSNERQITRDMLLSYLPSNALTRLPAVVEHTPKMDEQNGWDIPPFGQGHPGNSEILYKMLIDLKMEVAELSRMLKENMTGTAASGIGNVSTHSGYPHVSQALLSTKSAPIAVPQSNYLHEVEEVEEISDAETPPTLDEMEREYILQVLSRNGGNRKKSAADLKISERTLYRKLKEHRIE